MSTCGKEVISKSSALKIWWTKKIWNPQWMEMCTTRNSTSEMQRLQMVFTTVRAIRNINKAKKALLDCWCGPRICLGTKTIDNYIKIFIRIYCQKYNWINVILEFISQRRCLIFYGEADSCLFIFIFCVDILAGCKIDCLQMISVVFDPSCDHITYSNKIRFQRKKKTLSKV